MSRKSRPAEPPVEAAGPEVDLLSSEADHFVRKVRSFDQRGLARVLSMVENGHPLAPSILHSLYNPQRSSLTIGITGPPGAGKSTLTNRLISYYRRHKNRVGVIAVDPSSPFSGGALLGDRVRMQEHASDPGVFIRSAANRGHLGGLSGTTRDALEVLAAASYDPVLVETMGVGQAEVEIASLADITLLVLVPGLGDEVQTMKAGIMEIGDILVLNKADRSGIEQLEMSVNASLELIPDQADRPPVIRCSAQTGEGIAELTDAIGSCTSSGAGRKATAHRRTALLLNSIVREKGRELAQKLLLDRYGSIEETIESILEGRTTPYWIGEMLSGFHNNKRENENECKRD
ncbi:MAG: methylmalonyl Co-A mutase-associated GTPase MeaB [Candidatus Aegiribacteria sp.]|nr:methylmalonyl Co-A mutase-associated GTPase MeaB [Candidatus Aegiribacteria sp.]